MKVRELKLSQHGHDIKETLMKPVVLVGMMGTGKSHLGRLLAKRLELSFTDSDSVIEERAGCSIPDIFENFGEDKFRASEERVIESVLDGDVCVLSTGGGAVLSAKTREILTQKAIVVWLDVDVERIYERVQGRTDRPLLNTANPQNTLEKLLDERRAFYAQADIHLKIDGDDPYQTLEMLIKELSDFLSRDKV